MATTRFLRRLLPYQAAVGLPRSDVPLVAIGDIHGCDDLLTRMLARLAAAPDAGQTWLICLGDMIDKGPDSAAVLHRLWQLCRAPAPFAGCVCLLGDHERRLLTFLADPLREDGVWLRNGGMDTLLAFGIDPPPPRWHRADATAVATRLLDLHRALTAALPPDLRTWMAGLPLLWRRGALAFSHAGADPGLRLEDQPEAALLSGHPAFRHRPRRDGIWLVHGHVEQRDASAVQGRIAVDTGAWRTGRLSAVRIDAKTVQFLTISRDDPAMAPRFARETSPDRLSG